MQVCTLLQTDNHASTPPLSFLQAGCPSCRPTNSVKALKAFGMTTYKNIGNFCDILVITILLLAFSADSSIVIEWAAGRASGL